MISYERDPQQTIPESSVKIIGLGGAGANMLDRAALDGMTGTEMLCINTDMRTLSSSVAGEKIQIGKNLTKGLGAGGDPELGLQAAQESETDIRDALRGRKMVFLCVGLGGGTGSGAAPLICRIAREEDAFVVVFATMPFGFEGKRRRDQAETSLNELAVLANALVTFDNGRMGELVLAKQGIHEAFAAADRMISESIKAVTRLVVRPGLINVGLDDLMAALRTTRSRCLFGSGIADGENRSQLALENALTSPLLDKGSLLEDATTVLVHICGGETLTLYEVELLMQGLSKHIPNSAHVLFGAAVDPAMGDTLSVTLVSALPEDKLMQESPSSFSKSSAELTSKIAVKAATNIADIESTNSLLEPTEGFANESPSDEPDQPTQEQEQEQEEQTNDEAQNAEITSEQAPIVETDFAEPEATPATTEQDHSPIENFEENTDAVISEADEVADEGDDSFFSAGPIQPPFAEEEETEKPEESTPINLEEDLEPIEEPERTSHLPPRRTPQKASQTELELD
ncbi:MAG: cell division protein FtsZ, partial [Akkermansiaceae bacterium]